VLQSTAGAAAEQGLKVLRAPSMQIVLAAIAHPKIAALVLRCLLALPHPKDAKSGMAICPCCLLASLMAQDS
jgi:hypothetical protein